MSQGYVFLALVVCFVLIGVFGYLWYTKLCQLKILEERMSAEIVRLSKCIHESVGKITVLERQMENLSREKDKALQQYHSTDTLLTAANQAKIQQENSHKMQVDALHSSIKALEEKMNLAIGNYQAERRRNLIAEKAYVQEALSQLNTLEKNLLASQQAFNKPSAKGTK